MRKSPMPEDNIHGGSSGVVGRSWDWVHNCGTKEDGEIVDKMGQKCDRTIEEELCIGPLHEELIVLRQSQSCNGQKGSIELRNMQDSFKLYYPPRCSSPKNGFELHNPNTSREDDVAISNSNWNDMGSVSCKPFLVWGSCVRKLLCQHTSQHWVWGEW